MKLIQKFRAHFFKVTLSLLATLLIVRYWWRITLESHHYEPIFLINSSKAKSEFLVDNVTIVETVDEYVSGNFSQNTSTEALFKLSNETVPCPPIPPNLNGPIRIRAVFEEYFAVEKYFEAVEPGGTYRPKECKSRYIVALVIPYRDRPIQLAIFLNNIHRLLMKQQIDYTIFVVEQQGNEPFNRGKLMNIGFNEASKIKNFDCFIFHDVDLIPEDDRNLYTCPEQPRHMSAAVNIFNYKLPYKELFGGVCALSREQFILVNGFSNQFWGWGGEDDDLYNRVKKKGLHISRYPPTIARYMMLAHPKQVPNPRRFELLQKGKETYDKDGLNNLTYEIKALEMKKLYTWILVDLLPPKSWFTNLFHLWT